MSTDSSGVTDELTVEHTDVDGELLGNLIVGQAAPTPADVLEQPDEVEPDRTVRSSDPDFDPDAVEPAPVAAPVEDVGGEPVRSADPDFGTTD